MAEEKGKPKAPPAPMKKELSARQQKKLANHFATHPQDGVAHTAAAKFGVKVGQLMPSHRSRRGPINEAKSKQMEKSGVGRPLKIIKEMLGA